MARLANLDGRQRLAALVAVVATVVMTALVATMGGREEQALLYAGLEPMAAGQVIAALDARGVEYDVRGGAIFVPEGERDALRMTLAGEGLPAIGAVGYELLDELSGFGTTSQMFDAAYWRAKEGELARTIVAGSRVRSARVHISAPASGSFVRRDAASASVTVSAAGGTIDAEYARALRFLVASAVPGLSPDDVAVIDAEGGLIEAEAEDGPQAADSRAEALRLKVERLLEARVGRGNAVVEVAVEAVTEREQVTERVLDPESRVVIATDSEESSGSSTGADEAVTVASNLPEGDADPEGGRRSQESETRERVNYDVSETRREILREPGAVKRLTVAVLVDGVADGSGGVAPRDEEEIEALRALVASAVGYDEARGDSITIRSMAFEGTTVAEPPPPAVVSFIERLDLMRLVQIGVAALVAIVLGLFVLRPILAGRGRAEALPALPPAQRRTEPEVLAPGEEDGTEGGAMRAVAGPPDARGIQDRRRADERARVRGTIDEHREESMEVLRGWLETPEEKVA